MRVDIVILKQVNIVANKLKNRYQIQKNNEVRIKLLL